MNFFGGIPLAKILDSPLLPWEARKLGKTSLCELSEITWAATAK
jgi:hypothetical protein